MIQKNNWKFNFALLWSGQVFGLISTSIIQFSLIWWLTEKTGSAITLSLATLATFLPEIIIGPLFGPLVDRSCRKKILIFSAGGIAAVSLLLRAAFQAHWTWTGIVLAAMLARSIFNVVRWPTLEAAAAQIVPMGHLTRINAVDYIIRGTPNIIGPLFGAILMRTVAIHHILLADLFAALLVIVPLALVRLPKVQKPTVERLQLHGQISHVFTDFRHGLQYVRKTPGLFTFLGYVSLTNLLLTPTESLLPLIVSNKFFGNETSMSIIGIAFGFGTVLGAVLLGLWGGFKSRTGSSISGDLLFGVGVLLIGLTSADQFPLAVFGWGIAGIGESFCFVNMNALIQSRTRPEMRGRVFSIATSMINFSIPMAMVISGPAAQIFGVSTYYIFCGISTLLFSGSMLFIPAMFRFERSIPKKSFEPPYEKAY